MRRPSELVSKTIKDAWMDEKDRELQIWFDDGTKLVIEPSADFSDEGFLSLHVMLGTMVLTG